MRARRNACVPSAPGRLCSSRIAGNLLIGASARTH
ncbi:hypothetical protein XOCgx_0170 [Xanthomonas oryzae pv. oryzicola]|nr:hypothetical protein XOCgx_0170 [Xanthomonas oryzae pv. oryzicola]